MNNHSYTLVLLLSLLLVLSVVNGKSPFEMAEQETAASLLEALPRTAEAWSKKNKSKFELHTVLGFLPQPCTSQEAEMTIRAAGVVLTHISPMSFVLTVDFSTRTGFSAELVSPLNVSLLEAIRKKNSKIVPRFALSGFGTAHFTQLLSPADRGTKIPAFVATVKAALQTYAHLFDGMVLDIGDAPFRETVARRGFEMLFNDLRTMVHDVLGTNSKFFLTIPGDRVKITPKEVTWLQACADLFVVTTFDFAYQHSRPSPVAPLSWIEGQLSDIAFTPPTLVFGMGFLGYEYKRSQKRLIHGKEYVELLERYRSSNPPGKLDWSEDELEHRFSFYSPGEGHIEVRFPSRASILHRLRFARKRHCGVAIMDLTGGLELFLLQF